MTDDEFATPGPSPRDYVPRGDAEARAKVPRDQWDRYLMPHLDGTKVAKNKGFTRVSTIKSGLSNQTGIKVWTGEKIVEGLGQDTQLVEDAMRAAKIVDPEDRKRTLRKIADRAFVAGGGKDRSGKGTEFHEITEVINRHPGVEPTGAPESIQPELTAYYQMLSDHDVQILPDMLERQVLCPYNAAGTFDNMVRWWNPDTEEWELCIADLKTGRDLSLGWLEILMQLWSYANAYGLWTTTDVVTAADGTITDVQGFYEPMPLELRKDKALIFHVPLDGTATLYVLDLSGVERYVAAAVEAKRANAEAKHKVRKVGTVAPAAFVAPSDQHQRFMPGDANLSDQVSSDGGQTWASVPLGATRNTEPTNQTYNGRPVTADQQAQADKAAERLAKVAAMANPNTDGDDEANRPFTAVATAGGEHVERDPVTGRKKRTCGHCRKPGHTQKNCPENPASAKFQGDVGETTPPPADPAAQAYVPESELDYNGTEDPNGRVVPIPVSSAYNADDPRNHRFEAGEGSSGMVCTRMVMRGDGGDACGYDAVAHALPGWNPDLEAEKQAGRDQQAYDYAASTISPEFAAVLAPGHYVQQNTDPLVQPVTEAEVPNRFDQQVDAGDPPADPIELPYCHLAHAHEWTSTHPAAPGQWVCATTGKPSREVFERGQGETSVPLPSTGEPVGTIAPPAWAAPHPSVNYTAVVLGRIEAASTQAELLRLRADAIEAGHWVETVHNDPAMARYQALA